MLFQIKALSGKKYALASSLVSFWIFGLCNNYAYVIMLSAAEDILEQQQHKNTTKENDDCEDTISSRHCTTMSTGAVLIADVLPTVLVKLTFPLFMQRIPFGVRHLVVCVLQTASYFIVAFSVSVPMSLFGVVVASLATGLGEITYLSLTPFYNKNTISTWSSGTGGAGVIGALAYAGLTEPHMANLTPKTTLLVMLVIPALFAFTYWFILVIPETVYQVSIFNPKSWIVPESYMAHSPCKNKSKVSDCSDNSPPSKNGSLSATNGEEKKEIKDDEEEIVADKEIHVKQRKLTLPEKLRLVLPLLRFMIPLMTVYIGEYLINQGIVQLIFFDCSHGWSLSRSSQYRWYQVIYQVGVFFSRSSINVVQLPYPVLILLPILQICNMVLFLCNSLYFFIPHIWILFLLILFEGFFGGSSYVNTFNHIHRNTPPDIREYSMSVGSLGDSIGILIAGFTSIPIHNAICSTPLP